MLHGNKEKILGGLTYSGEPHTDQSVFSGWWQRGMRELKGEEESVCLMMEAASSLRTWQGTGVPPVTADKEIETSGR